MSSPYSPPLHDSDPPEAGLGQDVRGLQIITLALASGAMFFMFVALVAQQGALGREADITSWIGLGFAAVIFVVHLVAPNIVADQILNQINREELKGADALRQVQMVLPAYRAGHIIGCALLEGAAFMNLVFYMTEQYVGNIAVAAFFVVIIVLKLPTASRVTEWARQRIQEIELR